MIDRLILGIADGSRAVSGREIQQIRDHIADAGFTPAIRLPADRRVIGLVRASGPTVAAGELLPAAELHFLRHVVAQQEWPAGTSQSLYERSLREVGESVRSGVLLSEVPPFGLHVAMIGRSGAARGPRGFAWIVVEYRVATGHWVTGYQPVDGIRFAHRRRRRRWLRLPT